MFNSIIDSIEKPPSLDISSYQSTVQRNSVDDHNLNPMIVENHDRFRKFLQLAIDYIYSFHNECQYFEIFTLRLLDICLLGIAYLLEKRSTHANTRQQMSLLLYRCGDTIKQIGQKLLTIVLDPEKQRFFFRIKILKHIIDQPNAKAIMEYLLTNDTQCVMYHQILIYLQKLSRTTPKDYEFEQINSQSSSEQSRKSLGDSGRSTIVTLINTAHKISNGDDSTHTINISTKSNATKQLKSAIKRQTKTNMTQEQISTSDEDEPDLEQLSSSSPNEEREEIRVRKISERSSSPSLSISSISSELTTLHQSSIINYQNIINMFRDLMRTVNISSLTTNDINVLQRRALTDYLLMSSPSACKI